MEYIKIIKDKEFPTDESNLRIREAARAVLFDGKDLFRKFSELLKNAMTHSEDSFEDFRKIASEIMGIAYNYEKS